VKWIVALLAIWLAWRFLRPARAPYRPRLRGEADALRVLGLAPGADAEAVRVAHRRLAADAHPDRGGDPVEAARINAARDLLLRSRG